MIVIDTARATTIENTAIDLLTKKENWKKWEVYTEETLEDQQELYLAELNAFDDVSVEDMTENGKDYFFNLCVYLAVFRRLLQAKRIDRLMPLTLVE